MRNHEWMDALAREAFEKQALVPLLAPLLKGLWGLVAPAAAMYGVNWAANKFMGEGGAADPQQDLAAQIEAEREQLRQQREALERQPAEVKARFVPDSRPSVQGLHLPGSGGMPPPLSGGVSAGLPRPPSPQGAAGLPGGNRSSTKVPPA